MSWVIALACFRGLTQERGVFLRTPKFATSRSIRELGVVWVEAVLSVVGLVLLVLLVLRAGYSLAGVTLAILLAGRCSSTDRRWGTRWATRSVRP